MALFTCFVFDILWRHCFVFYIFVNSKFAELCDTPSIKSILFEQHQAVTVSERDFSRCS